MSAPYKKIFVAAPGALVTGGPELLHQLVHELRSLGLDAHISYLPATRAYEQPPAYSAYDVDPAKIEDRPENLIIFPETMVGDAMKVRHAQCAIWWLSVDYYWPKLHESVLQDLMRMLLYRLRGMRPWFVSSLSHMLHFTQCAYARTFLAQHGIASRMLTDYLGADHTATSEASERKNRVLYNPRKGYRTTKRLIDANPDIKFLPLQGMTAAQVVQAFRESKLYVDFGFHPGKDRMPREAALAGCCVVVGQRGAAAFVEDVAIASRYKLDERSKDFLPLFRSTVLSVFQDFEHHTRDFDAYRNGIKNEYQIFREQVRDIFLHGESARGVCASVD